MKSSVIKRSVVLAGHKTSVSLEDEFWRGLKEIAGGQRRTLSDLVAAIDSERQQGNLSSAIRLYVLDFHRKRLADLKALFGAMPALSDATRLELEVLPALGLNSEELNEMPEELYQFCGRGLHYWQYPNQLSRYLVHLSRLKIESYLEIGVRHGGTFVITVEYLSRFHPLKCAVGLDIEGSSLLLTYGPMNRKVIYMLVDSQSSAFKEFIGSHGGFDLVFIDGDHEEGACQNDFETVREKANICVLHDITSDSAPGPGRVWNRIKRAYASEYEFFEYTEQYESVRNRTGKSYLGIGMAAKKEFLLMRRREVDT
jgi:predicted DNA-binding ribbon-helix-helix protein/cephalosporin hydroxylase